jgi:predicted methyltransferase
MARIVSLSFAVAAAFAILTPGLAADIPPYVAAAVADPARPKEDTDRDAVRHPAEIMALAGVKPGHRVVDIGPGRTGYYTRIMSRIVGDSGKVYAFYPTWVMELNKEPQKIRDGLAALIASGYPNVEASYQPMAEIKFDAPLDVVFMSQLYHDQRWQNVDVAKMNKAIYDALRPGGVYFIIDHTSLPGVQTAEQIDKVHRIDPAVVKAEVLAAGFQLVAESDLLRNPDDAKTLNVFDKAIRGKTDQFVFKFVKPK